MSEEQSISVTMSDLKLLVDVEVIKTRMDTHDRASEERQKREEDLWKEVFDGPDGTTKAPTFMPP